MSGATLASRSRPGRALRGWRPWSGVSVFSDPIGVGAFNAGAVLVVSVVFLVRAGIVGIWGALPHGDVGVVDFAAFWASARSVLAGHAPQAYDWSKLRAILEQAAHVPVPHGLPIYYPPPFLALTAPLGLLPYSFAFALWVGLGLAAYAAAVRLASRRTAVMVVALAGAGVFGSAFVGQAGLFVAALLGASLAMADRRPWLAGALLGVLCCKPQFALLAPVALVAGGRWRVLAAAAATGVALALVAGLVLGWGIYPAFLTAAAKARHSFATTGWLPWAKVQTAYGALREAHVAAGWAFGAYAVAALSAAATVAAVWRANARLPLRVAAVAAATYVATPYAFSYDAPLLGLAMAFILADADAERPLDVVEKVALPAAFIAPFLANPWPTTFPSAIVLLALAARRARGEGRTPRITEISPQASHPPASMKAST